ncbi:HEPN domain-containing protein [Alcanivorax sediminis]|uniref:HEPN domain-containing protein n=1 Tax=Alcanivorax sediminis TaxID=2663008 RepID=UPI001EECCA15|nr:HEPN domain-containing protein [Alcanivorax sediminis]
MGIDYKTLKNRQRQERDNYPDNLGLRVHRALSWFNRAEQEADPDSRFIFLWIAFNAGYAKAIRVLLDPPCVYFCLRNYQNGKKTGAQWSCGLGVVKKAPIRLWQNRVPCWPRTGV